MRPFFKGPFFWSLLMSKLINAITFLLIVLSSDAYSIDVEGIKVENLGGEVLISMPEGARDPVGTLVFSNQSQNEIIKIRIKKKYRR